MAVQSSNAKLNKVLAEKMRSSCVDNHYTSKYWVRFDLNDSTKPFDAPRDDAFFGNTLTKLLLLPIWLPYWFWDKRKKKRDMIDFVLTRADGEQSDGEPARQLALEWVGLNPREFVLGEYDPEVAKLESNFAKILREHLSPSP